ncbi:predicted protein [Histoplasma capsulatum var. duboisii H88]|uniref:Predicted protein n=1 Tax=Ajellomyces capsulatus (strain H88) TaxID=544711 RepID=F0UQR9_AJEC8|nr:predicted protein [Histoplasma capsulatum var. duboisii H88]
MFIFTLEEAAVVTAFLKLAAELLALPNFGWNHQCWPRHKYSIKLKYAYHGISHPLRLAAQVDQFWVSINYVGRTIDAHRFRDFGAFGGIPYSKYQALTAVDSLYLWVHTFSTDVTAKAMDNTWTDSQEYRDYTIGERVFLGAGNASCQSLNAATYHIQNLTLRITLLIHQPTGSVKGESRHSQLIMQRTFLYHSTFAFSQMVTD